MSGKPKSWTRDALVDRIDNSVERIPFSGCWIWLRTIRRGNEYGRVSISGRTLSAHRWVYEVIRGRIPNGLELDHICKVRCCVNPDHLEPVTHKENTLRGIGPTSQNAKKTHCVNGHELSGANLGEQWKGMGRKCVTCSRRAKLDYYYREKSKNDATA